MKTKLFTLLLAIVAGIGTMHAAIVNGTCGDNLTWSLNTKDSTLTIEGSGVMTSAPWSEYKQYVAYISLPNGLTSICATAFSNCSNLTSINIPNSVTSIGEQAFEYCSSMNTLTISNSVTSLKYRTFFFCSALTIVTIPNSITNIGFDAFSGCSGLTSVVIGNSVENIGEWAFADCVNLERIDIPNSVTNIKYHAFHNCYRLDSVIIPNSVTSIGIEAFDNCTNMTTITISNNVTAIQDRTFAGCYALKSVEIPNSVTRIGEAVFERCKSLTSITISNSVTSIGSSAFSGCSGLTSITIPNSVTSIGSSAFYGCNLSSITCEAVVPPTITSNTFSNKSILIFVPEESIEAYQNALYWEEFTNIRAIGSAPLVKFVDWDGTVLSSENVTIGEAATPPADPTRTGYTFIGWDKNFSNITKDLVVTAQYQINRYKVDFVDWDNTVLKTDSVDYNSAAIAPANPSREGHEFIGWNKDFSHVVSDMTITAQYAINYYPVGFLNYDGTLLSEQSIAYNQAAMEPEVPAREGYTFIGWTADITHITARTFAIALYEKQGLLLVTYKNEEGETISTENVDLHLPEAPEIEGFTFIGWQASGMLEEDGIILQAVYTADSQTSAPAVVVNPANKAQKLIRNGNVYILTDTKTYTIQGQVK